MLGGRHPGVCAFMMTRFGILDVANLVLNGEEITRKVNAMLLVLNFMSSQRSPCGGLHTGVTVCVDESLRIARGEVEGGGYTDTLVDLAQLLRTWAKVQVPSFVFPFIKK